MASDISEFLERIESLLIEIRDNTKPKVKRERVQSVGDGLPSIVQIWNEWASASFPRVTAMEHSSSRYKNANARWKENNNKEFWIKVIQRVNNSSFCRGVNDRTWVADIEWLVRPDVCHRILEGKYDDKTKITSTREKQILGYTIGADGVSIPIKG